MEKHVKKINEFKSGDITDWSPEAIEYYEEIGLLPKEDTGKNKRLEVPMSHALLKRLETRYQLNRSI